MNSYDIYLNAIQAIARTMSLPIKAMTPEEFTAHVAAAERQEPRVFSSLIDMDAFETAYRA